MSLSLITPNWPAPAHIEAFATTRLHGVSKKPYDSLNLALHVGDEESDVETNRNIVVSEQKVPTPQWLNQTHSTVVINHGSKSEVADGCFTSEAEKACLVMTADCLPILLTNKEGSWVAAVHAGWRGLADGILEKALSHYRGDSELMAWVGPAICQQHFEVGSDVKDIFVNKDGSLVSFFKENQSGKWLCNLPAIAENILKAGDVRVYLSGLCTYGDSAKFYSHRRATHTHHSSNKPVQTGRMVSVIWIKKRMGSA